MKKRMLVASTLVFGAFSASAQDALQDKIREETCVAMEKAIATNVKNVENPKKNTKAATWSKLADAYLDMAINCGKDSMASMTAYNTYKKAIEVEPAAKDVAKINESLKSDRLYGGLMTQGAAFYGVKELTKALQLFELANDVKANDTTAALYAGIVAQQNQKFDVAKKYFDKFIANNGKDAAVYYSLAVLLSNENKYDEAIATLKKGIIAQPNDKDLKGELINTYIRSNKIEDAIADLSKLVEADPKNTNNLLNLGLLYDNVGKKDMAMAQYQKVLAVEPNNYDANFSMAVIYFNEAVEIKKKVDDMDMKTYRAEGKAVEEKACSIFSKSLPYFEKCNEVKPNQDEVTGNLGTLKTILSQCGK